MDEKIMLKSPIDGSIYAERDYATEEEITQAFNRSIQAQQTWKNTDIYHRQQCCREMVNAFTDNAEEIAEQLCWMMGRPIRYAKSEIQGLAERANYMIDIAPEALKTESVDGKPGFNRFITREPLGVCFVIAPWNYPYLTAVNTIIPAIMAGNSVVLKHSALTALCAEQFSKAFDQSELAADVFQHLHLTHKATENILQQQKVHSVSFTGSTFGGEQIERSAAGKFININLELGGKDPAYVRADADLQHAVETCIDGAFFNSGQSCCGIERIYVAESLFDEFVSKATEMVKGYILGRPDDPLTTLGPVISPKAADFIRDQIDEALNAGATAHVSPSEFPLDKAGTPYLAPQLLTNVDHNMRVMTEESFGPIVGIMKVKDDDEAVKLMNDSEFGLTASVFTQNMDEAIKVGQQLDTGTFFVNRCDYLDPALAWTGVKNSGRGCSLSAYGYHALTRPKSYHIKTEI